MSYWVIIYRLALGLLIVLCVTGLTCIFLPRCNSLRELQRKRTALREENHVIAERTRELRVSQERFRTEPAFVERTARETGMIRPDETLFKFTDGETPAGGSTP
jgi:cell division protein FtsB